MPGISREEFLETVRQAAAKDIPPHGHPVPPVEGEPGRAVIENPIDYFAEMVVAADMNLTRVADMVGASEAVREVLSAEEITDVMVWPTPEMKALNLSGFRVTWWNTPGSRDNRREDAFAMMCGITGVDYAVAETGSLVLCGSEDHGRSVSMLGELHIAVVKASSIVPDLYDLYARLPVDYSDGLPANISLVTGPSKTADIELTLVIGVHGPGKVWVVLVEDM
jgi:L-lactate dehydrogenase complex protein LldG